MSLRDRLSPAEQAQIVEDGLPSVQSAPDKREAFWLLMEKADVTDPVVQREIWMLLRRDNARLTPRNVSGLYIVGGEG